MAKSYYDYLQEVLKNQEETVKNEKKATEDKFSADKTVKIKEYNDKIKSIDKGYDESISQENIQRLIEERKIKEAIGNMGLLDSGHNSKKVRDNLHKANVESKMNANISERNNEVLKRDNEVALLDGKKQEEFAKIDSNYLKKAENTAESLYKEELKAEQHAAEEARKLEEARIKAETERIKAEQKVEAERIKAEAKKYSSSSKKSGTNKDSSKDKNKDKEEKEKEPEYVYDTTFVPDEIQMQRLGAIIEGMDLIPKNEYANERRMDKTLPTYSMYINKKLIKLLQRNKIDMNEYEYLKDYYHIP